MATKNGRTFIKWLNQPIIQILTPMENFMNCCREHDLKITLPIRHPGIKMKRKKRWEGEYLHIPIQGDIETFFIVTTAELF